MRLSAASCKQPNRAGAVGAWVITAVAGSYFAGVLGCVIYAVSAGLPIVMIAYFGEILRVSLLILNAFTASATVTDDYLWMLQNRYPHILSSSDFARWRFGPMSQLLTVLLTLFNMAIAMLVEYVSMGSLFSQLLGSVSYGQIVFYGVLTMLYTGYGGVKISIITDQFQGIMAVILSIIVFIYVAVTYRVSVFADTAYGQSVPVSPTLTKPMPNLIGLGYRDTFEPQNNYWGYSYILAMPVSLFTATIYSEAMWQRCWAAMDRKTLIRGSWLGCIGVILLVWLATIPGWLPFWVGYTPSPSGDYSVMTADPVTDGNLQFFFIFKDQVGALIH